MSTSRAAARPKHLNLFVIRLPIPGIMSIMHRVSGFVLFLALPLFLCGLQASLTSPDTFAQLSASTSRVIIINYSMPIWASLVAWLLFRERILAVG